VIDYSTAFGQHSMTVPSRAWISTSITGALGSYSPWTGSNIDAEVIIKALIDKLKVFVPASTSFNLITIYTKADALAPNIPQATLDVAIVGTSGSTGLAKAMSTTFNFKTTANGNAKLVLLDAPLGGGGLQPIFPSGFSADAIALADLFTDPLAAFSGRDDNRPNVMRKITFDLNNKLQKAYHMN
jgi:hypothetical protein